MHVNHTKLYYVRKNKKDSFDIMQVDFLKENAPEKVVGTDYYKIIATACIAEGKKYQNSDSELANGAQGL